MSKTLKLVLAGGCVACAVGGFAFRVAWATPSQGVIGTPVAGPALLESIETKSESDSHELEVKTRGQSDAIVTHNRILPGGYTGWHSHPGPVFILVTAGAATTYSGTDATRTPRVYPTGTAFVEESGNPHNLRNEGDTDLELVAFFLIPRGATRRIDEPQPPHYPF